MSGIDWWALFAFCLGAVFVGFFINRNDRRFTDGFSQFVIKKICNDLMDEGGNWRRGGENKAMEMVLLELGGFLNRLRNFSGQGDEVFLTRKERKAGTRKKIGTEK